MATSRGLGTLDLFDLTTLVQSRPRGEVLLVATHLIPIDVVISLASGDAP